MKKRLVALIMVLASTVSLTTSGFAANVNCKSDQFTSATEYAYNTDTETNVNSARDMIGDMVYNPKNQKSYVIPSDNFGASELKKTTRTSSTLTAQDLFDEFWDEELKCSVNQLKHYNIGDDVVVKDVVYEVAYDSDKDVTTLQFGNTSEGSCEWPFAGDLRERIKVGDELTFKFKIVEEYATEDYTFETLNYFLDSYDLLDNDSAADIDNYLLVSE